MLPGEPTHRRLRFGAFEADLQTGELTKQGKRIRLQEQPFQLLSALLEKPGEVVIREELQARLWPKTIVDFDHGLNKAISKIREALGDSSEHPRFVETVARRGYRFLADVTVVGDGQAGSAADELAGAATSVPPAALTSADHQHGRRRGLGLRLFGFGLAAVLAISLTWTVYPWRGGTPCRSFAPWQCCRWKIFPAILRRTTSLTA